MRSWSGPEVRGVAAKVERTIDVEGPVLLADGLLAVLLELSWESCLLLASVQAQNYSIENVRSR